MKLIDNYRLEEVVGSGSYGKVHRSKNIETGELLAIKVIPKEKFRKISKLWEFTKNEINILTRIRHPNIISYIEIKETMNNAYMVYEFCDGGTLESKIYEKGFLQEKDALKFFSQILSSLVYLESEKILHRDIKPSNIMLHQGNIKLGDFGFCKQIQGFDFSQTMVGSPIYMAPEILKNTSYTAKADVWSTGVLLFEMIFGICPYEEKTIPRLLSLLESRPLQIPRHIQNISPETEKLIRMFLTVDPYKRCTFQEGFRYLSSYFQVSNLQQTSNPVHIPKQLNNIVERNYSPTPVKPPIHRNDSKSPANILKYRIIERKEKRADQQPNTPAILRSETPRRVVYKIEHSKHPSVEEIRTIVPDNNCLKVKKTEINSRPLIHKLSQDKEPSMNKYNQDKEPQIIERPNKDKIEMGRSQNSFITNSSSNKCSLVNYQKEDNSKLFELFLRKIGEGQDRESKYTNFPNLDKNESLSILFEKRSKYTIILYCISSLLGSSVSLDNFSAPVFIAALKKVNLLVIEAQLYLSSIEEKQESDQNSDFTQLKTLKERITKEISQFNKFFQDFILIVTGMFEEGVINNIEIRKELENYEVNDKNLNQYILKFINELQANYSNSSNKVCILLGILFIEEVYQQFGVVVEEGQNYPFFSVLSQMNDKERELTSLSQLKFYLTSIK